MFTMRNIIIKGKRLLFIVVACGFMNVAVAQDPPPPPPGGGHGSGSNSTGGSAPIGSGLGIMLLMATVYGGYKLYEANNKAV